MKRLALWGGLSWVIACGGNTAQRQDTTTPTSTAAQAPTPATPPPTQIRAVNFGAIVRGVQGLISGAAHVEAGCLLGAQGDEVLLGVTPSPALGTLPDAPMHLAESLAQNAGHARVLTRWGQRGQAPHDLVVASLTPLPPQAMVDPFVVLALTRAGVSIRETDRLVTEPAMSVDDAAVWLVERGARGTFTVLVTAEAEIPTPQVHALLRSLPSAVKHVALAIALDPATRLPDNTPQPPDLRTHCPDGLPEPAANAAEGDLPSASIVRSLSFIHEPLQRCLSNTNGPGASGGKVVLALRIAETGNVTDTCLFEDAIGDNVLAACLVETARTATFSRPHPIGFVDVHVPLSLAPVHDPPPRPVCE